MDERLFARLTALLPARAVVVASVVSTRGATPRKRSSRMLITADSTDGSVGGGLAEARVIDGARALLESSSASSDIQIELDGRAGSAGVCGGSMRIALRRWSGSDDRARAGVIRDALAAGQRVALNSGDLGVDDASDAAVPDVRLLIFGAGHCGVALCELAVALDFDRHVFDTRAGLLQADALCGAATHADSLDALDSLLDTSRDVQAVLLNRDYHADIEALEKLCVRPPRFLGMLGSRRRIAEVIAALPTHRDALSRLVAPVGLDIGAETPHEIAISILAQLIHERQRN